MKTSDIKALQIILKETLNAVGLARQPLASDALERPLEKQQPKQSAAVQILNQVLVTQAGALALAIPKAVAQPAVAFVQFAPSQVA